MRQIIDPFADAVWMTPAGPPGGPGPQPFGPPGGLGPQHFGPPGGPGAWGPGQGGMHGVQMGPPVGPPKKKSRVALFVGMGCLGLFLFVVGVAAFMLYFEEGKGIHVPDTEVVTTPVTPGGSYSVEFVWNGTSWAFNNVWLVIEDGQKSGGAFEVETTMTCDRSSHEEKKTVKVPSYDVKQLDDKGSSFSAWIYLGDEYERASARKITCTGTVTPKQGTWTKAHIAVTQRQRPSDFFAF